eukprot:2695981-Amphidinium_carterae.1
MSVQEWFSLSKWGLRLCICLFTKGALAVDFSVLKVTKGGILNIALKTLIPRRHPNPDMFNPVGDSLYFPPAQTQMNTMT